MVLKVWSLNEQHQYYLGILQNANFRPHSRPKSEPLGVGFSNLFIKPSRLFSSHCWRAIALGDFDTHVKNLGSKKFPLELDHVIL